MLVSQLVDSCVSHFFLSSGRGFIGFLGMPLLLLVSRLDRYRSITKMESFIHLVHCVGKPECLNRTACWPHGLLPIGS